jgi:hypothetical protein
MDAYRRAHPIAPPAPFKDQSDLRQRVKMAVFGDADDRSGLNKPIAHRPVKRKIVGALHEETLFGPVLDSEGKLTGLYTAKKSVTALDANHLRMPRPESPSEAVERLALRRLASSPDLTEKEARRWARAFVESPGYHPASVDPPPGKSGLVRDVALRARLRACLSAAGVEPDDFSANEAKKVFESGGFRHASGVPIRSVVLLRTMSEPVVVRRKIADHATGTMGYDPDPASQRAYVGGNNHHIEYRAATDQKGRTTWTGVIVSTFEAAQRKLARLKAFKAAGVPKPAAFRDPGTPRAELARLKARWGPAVRAIEAEHPLVDRRDDPARGGAFVMSLAEGETVLMKHKGTGEVNYFVVAKLDKPATVVLVPHWDARAAGKRKDSQGRPVEDSERDAFAATPADLLRLAPPGHAHAVKVRVSALGRVTVLDKD